MSALLWALGIACSIYVIYDVWTNNKNLSDGKKILWTILALLFSVVTAAIYYLTQKK